MARQNKTAPSCGSTLPTARCDVPSTTSGRTVGTPLASVKKVPPPGEAVLGGRGSFISRIPGSGVLGPSHCPFKGKYAEYKVTSSATLSLEYARAYVFEFDSATTINQQMSDQQAHNPSEHKWLFATPHPSWIGV